MGKLLELRSLALLAFSLFVASILLRKPQKSTEIAMATITEIFGVKIEKNPPQYKLDELSVTTWPNSLTEMHWRNSERTIDDLHIFPSFGQPSPPPSFQGKEPIEAE